MGLCRRIGAMNAYHRPHALGSVLVVVLRAIPKVSEGVPLDAVRVRLTRPAPLLFRHSDPFEFLAFDEADDCRTGGKPQGDG